MYELYVSYGILKYNSTPSYLAYKRNSSPLPISMFDSYVNSEGALIFMIYMTLA
jgi:hypothetical protein